MAGCKKLQNKQEKKYKKLSKRQQLNKPKCIYCHKKAIKEDLFFDKKSHFCTKGHAADYAALMLNEQPLVWNDAKQQWELITIDNLGGE